MRRFSQRALDVVAGVSLPGGKGGKGIAAIGVVAMLGLAVHAGMPGPAHQGSRPVTGAWPPGPCPPLRSRSSVRTRPPWFRSRPARPAADASGAQTSAFRQIILPDLLIVAPKGLTKSQIARLRKIAGVRDMITFDGAEITAGGRSVSVIGVNPATFRSWVPLATASDQAFWSALSNGDFVAAQRPAPSSACGPARDTSSPAPRRRPSGTACRPSSG